MISTWEMQRLGAQPPMKSGAGGEDSPAATGRSAPSEGNVSDAERILSGVVGGILLSRLSLRSLPGALTAVVGVGLVYRALSGRCPLYRRWTKLPRADNEPRRGPASGPTESQRQRTEIGGGDVPDRPSPVPLHHGFGQNIGTQTFDPIAEEAYWRENYPSRPYYDKDVPFDHYAAAYRYGWESRPRHADFSFHDVEPQLRLEWERSPHSRQMEWNRARLAVLDAWARADVNLLGES